MVGFEAVGFTAQIELSARRAIGGRPTERPLVVAPSETTRCSQPRLRFSSIYMVRDIACFAAPTCGRWRGQLRVRVGLQPTFATRPLHLRKPTSADRFVMSQKCQKLPRPPYQEWLC